MDCYTRIAPFEEFTEDYMKKSLEESKKLYQLKIVYIVITSEDSSWDVESSYSILRVLYQRMTNLMIQTNNLLADFRVLLFPRFCHYPLDITITNHVKLMAPHFQRHSPKLRGHRYGQYKVVAIEGTFDHLHAGHKLMLSVTAMLASEKIICGLTAANMLSSKKYEDLIQNYEDRKEVITEFMSQFKDEQVALQFVELTDPFGPTLKDPSIEALILSPETFNAGKISNLNQKYALVIND